MRGYRNSDLGPIHVPMLAGVERLWRELESGLLVNGQLVVPTLWFDGSGLDATAKTATCRKTGTVLSLSGAGSEPDFDAEGPFGRCLKFNAGKVLEAGSPAFGNISTEDFWGLMLYEFVAGVDYVLANKRSDEGSGQTGWMMRQNNSQLTPQMNFQYNGGAFKYVRGGPNSCLSPGWFFTEFYCNRDEASSNASGGHTNHGAVGTGDDVSAVPNCTSPATNLTLGLSSTVNRLALLALFKKDSWFQAGAAGPAEAAVVAKKHAGLLWGQSLLHNHGDVTPTTL